ncbi:PTS sugar transporter subunit IIA [Lactobacillus sp. DCY120]|uniref:PTS sugar transporter subunit IIA n=1 Tax=Bombilactobacillus apium TaxID=2675299 RepID=A0A850R6B7_9LACO|nr:PTS sugar transporter subunit IIA [Bombilactobacillus apium]NVY96085.1 PTS sugar transporter subunit IIA [Bombilactobacillus apium]
MTEVALLLMSHGSFAQAALASAELIAGPQKNCQTLGVNLDDQVDQLRQAMQAKVESLDTGVGLLVLTDILGGTPTNLASALLERSDVLISTGLNLPVLLEVLLQRKSSLAKLRPVIQEAYQAGQVFRDQETLLQMEADDDDSL